MTDDLLQDIVFFKKCPGPDGLDIFMEDDPGVLLSVKAVTEYVHGDIDDAGGNHDVSGKTVSRKGSDTEVLKRSGQIQGAGEAVFSKGRISDFGDGVVQGKFSVKAGIHENSCGNVLDIPWNGQASMESSSFEGPFSDFGKCFRQAQFSAQPSAIQEGEAFDGFQLIWKLDAFQ